MMGASCSRMVLLGVLITVAGCASNRPSSPPALQGLARANAERRLTAPFRVKRAVIADHLVFEVSANFDALVTRPATGVEHRLERRKQEGQVESRWTSKAGIQAPLRFKVGASDFLAIRTARLRVTRRGALGFSVIARGKVSVADTGGMKNLEEFRVADGVVSGR